MVFLYLLSRSRIETERPFSPVLLLGAFTVSFLPAKLFSVHTGELLLLFLEFIQGLKYICFKRGIVKFQPRVNPNSKVRRQFDNFTWPQETFLIWFIPATIGRSFFCYEMFILISQLSTKTVTWDQSSPYFANFLFIFIFLIFTVFLATGNAWSTPLSSVVGQGAGNLWW